jgi:hypothetical protein
VSKNNGDFIFQPEVRKMEESVAYLNKLFIMWLSDYISTQQNEVLSLEEFYFTFF